MYAPEIKDFFLEIGAYIYLAIIRGICVSETHLVFIDIHEFCVKVYFIFWSELSDDTYFKVWNIVKHPFPMFNRLPVIQDVKWLFSSPELKAQVSFSDRQLSIVCLFISLSIHFNISHFLSSLQNHWTNFNQTWHKTQNILGWRGFVKMKGQELFLKGGGGNKDMTKIHWQILKTSSPEPLVQFHPNLAQSILDHGLWEFKLVEIKGYIYAIFQGNIIRK